MPQPRSSSGRTTAKKAAPKKAASKPAAKRKTASSSTTKASSSRTTATKKATPRKTAPKATPAKQDDDRLAQLRELLSQAVVIRTERLQAVLDDARRRGHIDTKGVDAIRDGLLKQTDEVRGTLEGLLERGRSGAEAVVSAATSVVRRGGDKGGDTPDPTKLKAGEVTSKLDGLTAAQLKKVRKQEADGPKRKSVLAAIDRKLK